MPEQYLKDKIRVLPSSYKITDADRQEGYLAAGLDLGWPAIILGDPTIIQFGFGCRQFVTEARMLRRFTTRASICRDKSISYLYLTKLGKFPLPRSCTVSTYKNFLVNYQKYRMPLVIKPATAGYFKGISFWAGGQAVLPRLYAHARRLSPNVIVEEFCRGKEYRVVTYGSKVISAITPYEQAESVIGDGKSTAEELVKINIKKLPRRYPFKRRVIKKFLGLYKFNLWSVIPKGKKVKFYGRSNMNVEVTNKMHEDHKKILEDVGRVLGQGVYGIDYICPDISRPFRKVRGWINEVNANPEIKLNDMAFETERRESIFIRILKETGLCSADLWIPIYRGQRRVNNVDEVARMSNQKPREVTFLSRHKITGAQVKYPLLYYLVCDSVSAIKLK